MQEHERFCVFSYKCELCKAEGHLVRHFKAAHKICLVTGNAVTSYWHNLGNRQSRFFVVDNTVFKVKVYIHNLASVVTEVYCLYTKETCAYTFFYTMEYSNSTLKYVFTGQVLEYKKAFPIDNENFMRFPSIVLPFLFKNNLLPFRLKIMKFAGSLKLIDSTNIEGVTG